MDGWDGALEGALSVVVKRAVGEDAGAYAAWYSCWDLSLELFEEGFDARMLDRVVGAPFAGIEVLGELFEGWDLFAPHWTVDLGRSLFSADDDDVVPGLKAGMTGTELGAALAAKKLKARKVARSYPNVVFRLHTDASLFDALRTVTGTHRGPDHLLPLDRPEGVKKRWDARFADVEPPALADHLRGFFLKEQDARSSGALFLKTQDPSHGTLPHAPVAAWRFGEGQAWSAVTPAL